MPDLLTCILLIVKMVLVALVVTFAMEAVDYHRGAPMSVRGIQRSTAIGISTALVLGYVGWLS